MHVIKSKNIGKYSCHFNFVSTKEHEREGNRMLPCLSTNTGSMGKKNLFSTRNIKANPNPNTLSFTFCILLVCALLTRAFKLNEYRASKMLSQWAQLLLVSKYLQCVRKLHLKPQRLLFKFHTH